MHILLIDDQDDSLQAIGDHFTIALGATVIKATNGPAAKALGASRRDWSAIAIDRQLLWDQGGGVSNGDGLSLAAYFRREMTFRHTTIIVYSRGWVHENFDALTAEYAPRGIFPCDGAIGPDIASLIQETGGHGPWSWTPATP